MSLVRAPLLFSRPRVCFALVGVTCVALCMVLCIGRALAAPNPRPLTAEEWRSLGRDELVTHPTIERRGSLRLIGGSSWQVIDAKPSAVWQAVLDTSRYHRMLPRVNYAKLLQKSARERTVFVTHTVGMSDVSYFLKVKTYPERWDVTFALDDTRPHDIRAAWGFYSIRPYGNGKTLLSYGAMIDVGDGLIASLVRTNVQEWALKVPWMIKRFVEGSGRWIYR